MEEDLSKVDISEDFMRFPPLFSSPDDIENFIHSRNLSYPVLQNLLRLRKENKLDITPTESNFYFAELFSYIYDVYRVPVEETYKGAQKFLDYIESYLVDSGFDLVIKKSYERLLEDWETRKRLYAFLGRRRSKPEFINYYTEIGLNEKENSYYLCSKSELIEQFWIRSCRHSGQPQIVGDEAYMRVYVYPNRVYIFGCDDCSYTLTVKGQKSAKDFANYLKSMAPVWNFSYCKLIHSDLKFTN